MSAGYYGTAIGINGCVYDFTACVDVDDETGLITQADIYYTAQDPNNCPSVNIVVNIKRSVGGSGGTYGNNSAANFDFIALDDNNNVVSTTEFPYITIHNNDIQPILDQICQ